MRRFISFLVLILTIALAAPGLATDWFIRPYNLGGHGTSAGTSYNNAFNSLTPPIDVTFSGSGGHLLGTIAATNSCFTVNNTVLFFWSDSGSLPTGISAGTPYYASYVSTTTFKLSASAGPGALIADPGAGAYGSGTIRVGLGVDWGIGTGISAGDTVYICGDHGIYSSAYTTPSDSYAKFTTLTLERGGTSGTRLTISGAHPTYPGKIYHTKTIHRSGWTQPSPTNYPAIYSTWTSAVHALYYQISDSGNPIAMNRTGKRDLPSSPSDIDFALFTPGDWGYCSGDGKTYIYPAGGASADPNSDAYLVGLTNISNVSAINATNKDYVTVTGLSIYNGGGFNLVDCDYWIVSNNTLEESYGIIFRCSAGGCDYVTVSGNTITYCNEGIYFFSNRPTSYSANPTVTNNIVKYCGLFVSNFNDVEDHHGIAFSTCPGILCYDNYVDGTTTGVNVYTDTTYGASGDVYNNIVFDSKRVGATAATTLKPLAISSANPAVLTWASTSLVSGDMVIFHGLDQTGWSALNNIVYYVTKTGANTLELYTDSGRTIGLDTSGLGTYSVADKGVVRRVFADQYSNVYSTGFGVGYYGGTSADVAVKFYNNIVVNSENVGILIAGMNDNVGSSCELYNNTVYGGAVGIAISAKSGDEVKATIRNNIVSAVTGNNLGTLLSYFDVYGNTAISGWTLDLDYNSYYNPGSNTYFRYRETGSYSSVNFTDWKALSPSWESHSLSSDPVFVNAGGSYALATDFKLQATSPIRGAGYPWIGIDKDYGGRAFSKTRPSIGAWSWRGTWGKVNEPGKVGGESDYRPK